MKRIIAILTALLMLYGAAAALAEEDSDIEVVLDGETVEFPDQKPVISPEGRTLVPLRGVFEAAGAEVRWNNDSRIASVIYNDTEIMLQIGELMYVMRDVPTNESERKRLPSGVAPAIMNDRTLIPLRDVSELLGFVVEWVDETRTVEITTNKSPMIRTIVIGE